MKQLKQILSEASVRRLSVPTDGSYEEDRDMDEVLDRDDLDANDPFNDVDAEGVDIGGDGEQSLDAPPVDTPINLEDNGTRKQGLIRTVPNAHLIYKIETGEGTFEELWIYNLTDMKSEIKTRRAVLDGTDIPPRATQSPDGTQTYTLWSIGNAELLNIKGLPN